MAKRDAVASIQPLAGVRQFDPKAVKEITYLIMNALAPRTIAQGLFGPVVVDTLSEACAATDLGAGDSNVEVEFGRIIDLESTFSAKKICAIILFK